MAVSGHYSKLVSEVCFGVIASILKCPLHVRLGRQSRKRRLFVVPEATITSSADHLADR
jgi:hypothetical protein